MVQARAKAHISQSVKSAPSPKAVIGAGDETHQRVGASTADLTQQGILIADHKRLSERIIYARGYAALLLLPS